MRRNYLSELKAELEKAKNGESLIEECSGNESRETDTSENAVVSIRVSKSAYTRLVRRAKKAKMGVTEYVELLSK